MCINLKNQHTCWSSYLAARTYPMRPFMLFHESHFLQVALQIPLCSWLSYAYLSSYPHPYYIPWASQVHLVLVGINLLVCSIMVLWSLTLVPWQNLEFPMCASCIVVLLGAHMRRGICIMIHHGPTRVSKSNLDSYSKNSLMTDISPCMFWSHPCFPFETVLHCSPQ